MSDNWNFDGLVQDVLVKSGNKSCCGDISFPDTHKLDNPSNPQSTISNDLLNEFEKYLQELGIIEVAYVNGINDYFLHGLNFDFDSAIVISYEISKSIHDEGAGDKAQAFNNELYERFGNITYEISDYLSSHGFATMVAHGINGLDAITSINFFDDPNQVWERSRDGIEAYQQKTYGEEQVEVDTELSSDRITDQIDRSPNING